MADLNVGLQRFNSFLEKSSNVSDNTAVVFNANEVKTAETTSSWLGRKLKVTSASKEAINNNNTVRDQLVAALKDQFNVKSFDKLPESVKTALKGTHASTAKGDFEFDENENAQSGKPLTKRRIQAVLTAVYNEIKTINKVDLFKENLASSIETIFEIDSKGTSLLTDDDTKGIRELLDNTFSNNETIKKELGKIITDKNTAKININQMARELSNIFAKSSIDGSVILFNIYRKNYNKYLENKSNNNDENFKYPKEISDLEMNIAIEKAFCRDLEKCLLNAIEKYDNALKEIEYQQDLDAKSAVNNQSDSDFSFDD